MMLEIRGYLAGLLDGSWEKWEWVQQEDDNTYSDGNDIDDVDATTM